MKVAIVRGSNMNPFEMQSYEPLASSYDLTGYASLINNYDISRIRFPIRRLHIAEEYYEGLPWPLSSLGYGALLPYGMNYRMFGLEKEIDGVDIIHAAETYNGYSYQGARVRNRQKKRLVLTIWENVPFLSCRTFRGLWGNEKVVRYVRDSADLFIAITERAGKALAIEGVSQDRIRVIPAGVDTDRFAPGKPDEAMADRLHVTGDDLVVLFVGRLTREKGVYDLIYAAKLASADPELRSVKFLIAGEGSEKQRLVSLIKMLGIDDKVKLIGNFSYQDMPKVYSVVDAFILPSIPVQWWQEQFGMVLVEAMASGLPIISTMSGSIPEVVGDAGILVQPGDPVSIYGAIKNLASDGARLRHLGRMSRHRAEKEFDIRRISGMIGDAYRELE